MKMFIITDPCYIMDKKQYQDICDNHNCEFENQTFPLKSKHRYSGKDITFHVIEGTGGDGSLDTKYGFIGIDAGMLCIAEAYEDDVFYGEAFGAKFETKEAAEREFKKIIDYFVNGKEYDGLSDISNN